jgi:hypothetical protein
MDSFLIQNSGHLAFYQGLLITCSSTTSEFSSLVTEAVFGLSPQQKHWASFWLCKANETTTYVPYYQILICVLLVLFKCLFLKLYIRHGCSKSCCCLLARTFDKSTTHVGFFILFCPLIIFAALQQSVIADAVTPLVITACIQLITFFCAKKKTICFLK